MSDVVSKNLKLNEQLLLMLQPSPSSERGGLILEGGELIEFANISDEPEGSYYPDAALLLEHLPTAVGTWHTHPGGSANLSVEDAETFIQWPAWVHAVVGVDGVRWYGTKNGAAVNV